MQLPPSSVLPLRPLLQALVRSLAHPRRAAGCSLVLRVAPPRRQVGPRLYPLRQQAAGTRQHGTAQQDQSSLPHQLVCPARVPGAFPGACFLRAAPSRRVVLCWPPAGARLPAVQPLRLTCPVPPAPSPAASPAAAPCSGRGARGGTPGRPPSKHPLRMRTSKLRCPSRCLHPTASGEKKEGAAALQRQYTIGTGAGACTHLQRRRWVGHVRLLPQGRQVPL